MRRWAFACACGVIAGCRIAGVFACGDADDCVSGGADGICQPDGYCSFPDDVCASGQRYGEHAPGDLADDCVEDVGDTGTSSGVDSSVSTLETTATSTSGPLTASASEDSSGPPIRLDTSTSNDTDPGDPTTNSSTVSVSTNGSESGSPIDPYGPCTEDTDCPVMDSSCLTGVEASVCAPPCVEADDCPDSMVATPPTCGPGVCVLVCSDMEPCPDGMVCVSDGTCAWQE